MFSENNEKMRAFGEKCVELSNFLHEIGFVPELRTTPLKATYHDCCAGLREMGIKTVPRDFLRRAGVELVEMSDCEECCGFGGAFATKFDGISTAMAERKCRHIATVGVDTVIMGDLGCILHIGGRLAREGSNTRALHWAEALVND
ncbi:(Fe-S)-binding protein, partial [Candidatus Persebacteraceae bacterium Df01]|jgi:L-lactate dehydrogenase complex protein LldE|nr:(Fe-S)-binding protein [Candidatus Persebacteraceae bacterium Df01]